MTLPYPNTLNQSAISLIARELACNLNAAGGTEKSLFTVPVGKQLIVDHVTLHTFSADALAAVITLGKTGGDCDEFLGDQTLTGITAGFAIESVDLRIIPNATPVANPIFVASEVFAMEITTAAGGACTVTVEVWGHLIDA